LFQLDRISLLQFKNYQQATFAFTERIVGICGRNGMGKTNLLDAIHYLCFTKSYFGKSDAQHVHLGKQGFRVEGSFTKAGTSLEALCILRENNRKEFSLDGEQYDKFSSHIGKFPCVVIAPDDVQIITGGSEERRRFLDALVSQLDHDYLLHLISYNKILLQRNSLLKSFADGKTVDNSLLEVMNEQLARYGTYIFEKRKSLLQVFIPLVLSFYQRISGETYEPEIVYESQLHDQSFDTLFTRYRDKDLLLQRTNAGVHKDDLDMRLQGTAFKNIASQGQRKSLLFALKLAEFDMLKKEKGFPPLLLLDDVFEKLDEKRMHNLLDFVGVQNNGQVFITDTHRERLELALVELHQAYQIVQL
jgi:DNA replication and repair protein RecF